MLELFDSAFIFLLKVAAFLMALGFVIGEQDEPCNHLVVFWKKDNGEIMSYCKQCKLVKTLKDKKYKKLMHNQKWRSDYL